MKTLKVIDESGKCLSMRIVCQKGNLAIACHPETGNAILVLKEADGTSKLGCVQIAMCVAPRRATSVMKFLSKTAEQAGDSTMEKLISFMKVAFLERILCRVGEGELPIKAWVERHKNEFLPELMLAWEAVEANHPIRYVNRELFSFQYLKNSILEILG